MREMVMGHMHAHVKAYMCVCTQIVLSTVRRSPGLLEIKDNNKI